MTIKQKLTTFAVATMPMMPFVDLTILTAFMPATTANAEITNKQKIDNKKVSQTEAVPSFVSKTWQGENKFRVQFYKKNNAYNGKIVWLPEGAETKDVKNPDPKLRSRNLIGSVMLQGFSYDPAKKQLTGGVVYVPELGRMMKPKLTIVADDRIEMQVSMGIISRTVALTAVK